MQEITPAQALPLLGAFIHSVANEGFSKTRALTLTAATISGHPRAARNWLAAELGVVVNISADDGTGQYTGGPTSLDGHPRAARNWLAAELGVVVNISANDGTANLHPFLADTLVARQAWTAPKPKREPFTSDMFTYMFDDISKCAAAKPPIPI